MPSRNIRYSALAVAALACGCGPVGALAQGLSPFSVIPGAAAAANQAWTDQGCGYGVRRSPGGGCDIVKDPNAECQPGAHAVSAPSGRGSGSRCVANAP
jgi:hypothetical protein